jgi:hypothetical protein
MARYTGNKNRIARRFGVNIFGRVRNPLLHKPNPPGVHGARRRKKSDYGLQLEEKQKLKAIYGMLSDRLSLEACSDYLCSSPASFSRTCMRRWQKSRSSFIPSKTWHGYFYQRKI